MASRRMPRPIPPEIVDFYSPPKCAMHPFTIRQTDGMILEIIQVLELCSKPETNFSDAERADNAELIGRVLEVDTAIAFLKEEGYEAFLLLFRKRLATPDNLEMLLSMVDVDVQTGEIRCIAFGLLGKLVQVDFVWSLKMKDGSYFATSYLATCCKALENETNEDSNNRHAERSCECAHIASIFLFTAMSMTKDAHVKVIERVHSFNWAQILSRADQIDFGPYKWFISLYTLCMDVLKENADHSLAREFVRKLEMCHDFFCGALEHLVRLTRSLPSVPKEEIGKLLYRLNLIRSVLGKYSTRLTPPPTDPKTVLVRLAHHTLMEARPTVMAALQDTTVEIRVKLVVIKFVIADYDELLFYTDASQWAGLKNASERQRRQQFEADLTKHASGHKTMRRGTRKSLKNAIERTFGKDEMCANCYVLESRLGEGETLSKCGWCRQVTDCSRECQKHDWNKAHKTECAGRKK
jgi:hypothetical protein